MTTTRSNTILARGAFDLAASIQRREISSEEIVRAHIERLRLADVQINAVARDRYDEAIADAKAVDTSIAQARLRRESTEPSPLLGVPFTVKESVAVKGMPNSAGVLARREHIADDSATVVARLKRAGAIPIAVTNTSELTLWIESENPVYGRTSNPYDPTRTAGGSSGGEGAAVGCGGAPFGVGADAGGSIRIPALFCGVFGHKPSRGLIPNTGVWPGDDSTNSIMATGVFARRGQDLMGLLKAMAGPDGIDQDVKQMELGDPAEVTLDGLTVTTIAATRGFTFDRDLLHVRERAVGALASGGARIREVQLPGGFETVLPFLARLAADPAAYGAPDSWVRGGRRIAELLEVAGETKVGWRDVVGREPGHTLPLRLTLALEWFGRFESSTSRTRLMARAMDLADQVSEAVGDGVLLHPAFPTPAPRHRRTYGRPWLMMPAALFNMAGLPVTEVPMGLTRSGLPVGVQVAAPHGKDHLSIAIALELEAIFGGWVPPASFGY